MHTTGATISQISETSALISGDVSQINSLLEGAGGASITFDPYVLTFSNSQIQLTVNDGVLSSAPVSLTIQKQLIQDIITINGSGGLFSSFIFALQENIDKINNQSKLSNNSPITTSELSEMITKIEYVVQNSFTQAFFSGPYSAQQNHDGSNIIASIIGQSENFINIGPI